MIRLYIIGISILITAILCNLLISKLGVASWYDFLNTLSKNEPKSLNFIDYLWLFLFYPLFLGLGYYIGDLIFNYFLK